MYGAGSLRAAKLKKLIRHGAATFGDQSNNRLVFSVEA